MLRRSLVLVLVNVIVFCLFAELVALAVFYEDTGHLFYFYRKTFDVIPDSGEGRLTGDGLHPYFGPTHAPGLPFDIPEALRDSPSAPARLTTNNFGFVAPFDYPFSKTGPRQFVIGIFGGSVGAWFCQVGARRLVSDLQPHAAFRDRDIVPICFAHEGYKQPQQLLVLAYFLSIGQTFDLAINIDGFNEVTLGSLNDQRGFDVSMPSAMHLEPLINLVDRTTLTPEKLQSLTAIEEYKRRLNALGARMQTNRFAAVDFVLERLYRSARNSYQVEQGRFSNLPSNPSSGSLIMATRPVKARQGQAVYNDIARNWIGASLSMHALLAARQIPYVQILQPNQYYTNRRFTADEARTALSDRSPFKPGVEQGYPALLAAAESAQLSKTITFIDARNIFDREPSPVYIDDCCHYTLRGYQLLADVLAETIVKGQKGEGLSQNSGRAH
jgi:hypothetical protein